MPTIKDVALRAGVSVTTVSRVLNNRGYLSEELKKKVYQAMDELHYRPNELARSLSRSKSNLIGLIVPNAAHPFFGELISHIEEYAYNQGYRLLLCNSLLDRKKEAEYIDMLRSSRVDGIILGSHTLEVEDYRHIHLPVVTFDRQISDDIPYISSDNYRGGELATTLLADKGCRKIAHIGGHPHPDLLALKRLDAFKAVAMKRGIAHIEIHTDVDVFHYPQYGPLTARLLEEHPDIDGIFASSDMIAAYALKVCREHGRKIPDDIRVVGYDGVKLTDLFSPSLTTVAQPIPDMARRAVDLIIRQMQGGQVEMEHVFPVELVEGGTA